MIRRPPISTRTDTLFPYTTVNDEALLYRSNDEANTQADAGRFSAVRRLEVAGRVWLCAMNSRPAFDAHYGRGWSGAILLGGILVSLLLFHLTMRESRALKIGRAHV